MSEQQNSNIFDTYFEGLCTGMKMFEAVFDEYERCHPKVEPRVKTDDPATFEASLYEVEANHENQRRRA